MDLIDKEDVAVLEVSQDTGQITGSFNRRTGGNA